MNSIEKFRRFADELSGPPGEDADALELTIRTMIQMGGPLIEQLLPEDPQELDEQLVRIADGILSMRSDTATPVLLSSSEPIIAAGDVVERDQAQLEAG